MPIVTYNGTSYSCTKAVKGSDYIELRDSTGEVTGRFYGIRDFSGYTITDGTWSEPEGASDVRATAVVSGGDLVITADAELGNGTTVKFAAPCDCASVTGKAQINNVEYTIVDALDASVPGKAAWCRGAMVALVLDKANKKAYMQNQAMVGSVAKWSNIVVPVSGWVLNGDYYYNTVAVPGILASDNPHTVDIERGDTPSAIRESLIAFSKVDQIETLNGSIKLRAPYAKPTAAFTLRMEGTR